MQAKDLKYSKCKMSKNLGRDGSGAVEGDDEAEKCDEKHKCLLSGQCKQVITMMLMTMKQKMKTELVLVVLIF